MDRFTWEVDESVQLSSSLMAEHGTISSPEYSRPKPRLAAQWSTEHGVDPTVELLPAAAFNASDDLLSV